jgi:hypothetical protein
MTPVTVQVADELAERLQPLRSWLPTIIEMSLLGFKTSAISTVTELIQFLSSNPAPQEVLSYHASERSQERLRRLLALNDMGMLSEAEQQELDELQKLEHVVINLKAQMAKQIQP